ncbi:MAG: YaaA family protein [Nocardioides sp.]
MKILLPPSEGKYRPRRGAPLDLSALGRPELTDARTEVIEALVDFCLTEPQRAAGALGVPKSQADLVDLNAALKSSPTARADQIYTGVLYDALGFGTLSPSAKRRARSRVLITSSVFGLVSPSDRIAPYRLSGDASLPGLGSVAAHWRRHLMVEDDLVIDLRSGMYAGFCAPGGRVAAVKVLQERNGTRAVVSHFNKATKGRLVRALLESGASPVDPTRLAQVWRDLGWQVEESGNVLEVIVTEV